MNRIIAFTLSILLIFVLCSCNNNNSSSNYIDENKDTVSDPSNADSNKTNIGNTDSKNNQNSTDTECAHLWGQWTQTVKPTCDNFGTQIRKCINCSKEESKSLQKLSHENSDWIVDIVSTVEMEGKKHIECIYCKKVIKEESISKMANNHQHVGAYYSITKQPTCEAEGNKEFICSCGITVKTDKITATGHTVVVDAAVTATCESSGLTEGSHCSVCNTVIVEQTVTDKLPHTPITDKAVPATCKNTGLTEGKHCSACNKVIVAQAIVPKTDNHTSSGWIIDTEATCEAEGTRHKECTECGKILKSDTIEKRTEHTPMVKDVEIANGLFCGDDGEYFAVVKCKECGEKISEGKYNLPERHSMVNDVCEICGLPQSTTAGLYFGLNPDGKSYNVTPWKGFTGGDVVIGVYNGLSVTEMWGFGGSPLCEGLNSIVIGDCVKKIGNFDACTNLKNVVIGNGVKEIPEGAFSYCTSLFTVTIGDNVEKIGKNAFYKCNKLYYAYISGAHDWRCDNIYNNNVTIYGSWIGKEYENQYFAAKHLKEYATYEWTRK